MLGDVAREQDDDVVVVVEEGDVAGLPPVAGAGAASAAAAAGAASPAGPGFGQQKPAVATHGHDVRALPAAGAGAGGSGGHPGLVETLVLSSPEDDASILIHLPAHLRRQWTHEMLCALSNAELEELVEAANHSLEADLQEIAAQAAHEAELLAIEAASKHNMVIMDQELAAVARQTASTQTEAAANAARVARTLMAQQHPCSTSMADLRKACEVADDGFKAMQATVGVYGAGKEALGFMQGRHAVLEAHDSALGAACAVAEEDPDADAGPPLTAAVIRAELESETRECMRPWRTLLETLLAKMEGPGAATGASAALSGGGAAGFGRPPFGNRQQLCCSVTA